MDKSLTNEQVKFITDETGIKIPAATLEGLSGEDLDTIFDKCFDIETDEAKDTGDLSERGKMAVSIVNIFAQHDESKAG